MSATPWRTDPALAGAFHPEHPDDCQVVVHDGEPRRTQRRPEACWVTTTALHAKVTLPQSPHRGAAGRQLEPQAVAWREHVVYRGVLLNQPHHLAQRAGDGVLFLVVPGLPHPLQVSDAYLAERARWAFAPCDRCGADQALDPPSVMAATRFPGTPAGSAPVAFTAFCPCGGTMMLQALGAAGS
jgi:hypothetical protein